MKFVARNVSGFVTQNILGAAMTRPPVGCKLILFNVRTRNVMVWQSDIVVSVRRINVSIRDGSSWMNKD